MSDLSPVQVLLFGLGIGLLFGAFPFLLTMKDFVNCYFSARFSNGKRLLGIHSVDGQTLYWRVGFLKDGIWSYKNTKKDVRVFTLSDGVVKRTMGVNFVQLEEGSTAPFNFKVVHTTFKDVRLPVMLPAVQSKDDDGVLLFDKKDNPIMLDPVQDKDLDGNLLFEVHRVPETTFFKWYDDSRTLVAAHDAALAKKASKASMSFGNLDFKRLAIIAIVCFGLYYIVTKFVLPSVATTI